MGTPHRFLPPAEPPHHILPSGHRLVAVLRRWPRARGAAPLPPLGLVRAALRGRAHELRPCHLLRLASRTTATSSSTTGIDHTQIFLHLRRLCSSSSSHHFSSSVCVFFQFLLHPCSIQYLASTRHCPSAYRLPCMSKKQTSFDDIGLSLHLLSIR